MKTAPFLAALAALLLPLAASAADAGQLVDVVATGYGMSVDEAKKNAVRAAVEQVVGAMIDAETLVENDKLVENKILSYSAGLVDEVSVVGTPKKRKNGLVVVKVRATVKRTVLKEKISETESVAIPLDGDSIWAQAVFDKGNHAAAEAMIKDVLDKNTSCLVVSPVPEERGKSILRIDPATGEISIAFKARIDAAKYQAFVDRLLETMLPMSQKNYSSFRDEKRFADTGEFVFPLSGTLDQADRSFLVVEKHKSNKARVLLFEESLARSIREMLDCGSLAFRVRLVDGDDSNLAPERIVALDRRDSRCGFYSSVFAIPLGRNDRPTMAGGVFPWFGTEVFFEDHYNNDRLQVRSCNRFCPAQYENDYLVSFGVVDPEDLKSMKNLKIDVGRMKDGQFVE